MSSSRLRPWDSRLRLANELSGGEREAVEALVATATDGDGVAPLSEESLLQIRHQHSTVRHLLATGPSGVLVGYAQLEVGAAMAQAEFVVEPDARRHGLGARLLAELRAPARGGPLRVWAHGDLPAASALASAAGMLRTRVLRQVALPLATALPAPSWPPRLTIRTFDPGRDDARWVACNAAAFAHHPEQGGWTLEDLQARESEPWFDPAGFFLAEPGPEAEPAAGSAAGAAPELAGFHWTKVHPARRGRAAVGEVYVIGVVPGAQGAGLGRALLLHGLRHLAVRGLAEVMLYVDDDNIPAMTLYERMGFTRRHVDVQYETPGVSG